MQPMRGGQLMQALYNARPVRAVLRLMNGAIKNFQYRCACATLLRLTAQLIRHHAPQDECQLRWPIA